MKTIFEIGGYNTSKDYELLTQLMQNRSVICICDFGGQYGKPCRDVAHTLYSSVRWEIASRGIGYAYGFTKEEFIASCQRNNVEFLVPEKL